jgi:hypothetical protein
MEGNFMSCFITKTMAICLLAALMSVPGQARTALETSVVDNYPTTPRLLSPVSQIADHRVGKIQLSVTNMGTIGDAFVAGPDAFTGEPTVGISHTPINQ